MLQPRTPAVRPQVLESGDNAGGGQRTTCGDNHGRGIKADRILRFASIKVADLVDARTRDGVENVLGEITVRIDDRNALTCDDVIHREVKEERAFARAGLADDVDVALALLTRKDNAAAVRRCCYWKRLWLHTVAPASGENAGCYNSAAFAVMRSSLLVEVGTSAARRAIHGEMWSANYKRPAPRLETWSFSVLLRRVREDVPIVGLRVDTAAFPLVRQ